MSIGNIRNNSSDEDKETKFKEEVEKVMRLGSYVKEGARPIIIIQKDSDCNIGDFNQDIQT